MLGTFVRRQGGRTVTIHRVDGPRERIQIPKPPPPDLSDPEVQARIEEARAEEERIVSRDILPLSVTVFNHEHSLLRWVWRDPETGERTGYAAWSNIDFNHLCGIGEIEYGPENARRRCGLIMGIGNTDTARKSADRAGPPYPADLPADRPAFVLVEGDPSNAGAIALVQGLHDIHAREKDRLAAAYEGREAARIEREAYLKAHPPEPKDIVLHFSCGPVPEPPAEEPAQEGGAK